MQRRFPATAALILGGTLVPIAFAQQSAPPATQPRISADQIYRLNGEEKPQPAPQPMKRRSIVQHYPHPYPEYYHGDSTGGFRNPGGTGRYIEYYPPGNQFQVSGNQDAVKVATFGGGGVPDRNEQIAAQQVGIARYNAVQGHIDRMAHPSFGVGFFGGFN